MCNYSNQRMELLCPYCETENEVPMKAQIYQCNNCNAYLAPCMLCDMDTCDCANCEYAKQCDEKNASQAKIHEAVEYIVKELDDMSKDEVRFAYMQICLRGMSLVSANYSLKTRIEDLLNDFTIENNLNEDWWFAYYDVEDVFYKIYDAIY